VAVTSNANLEVSTVPSIKETIELYDRAKQIVVEFLANAGFHI
jgi:hypothetical protein